jgi:hypothetical protein
MNYLRAWISNLLIIVLVLLGTLMIAWAMNPGVLQDIIVWLASGVYLADALQLWPVLLFVLFVTTLPKSRRSDHHRFGW